LPVPEWHTWQTSNSHEAQCQLCTPAACFARHLSHAHAYEGAIFFSGCSPSAECRPAM
jgi:hypothetical protein